MGLIDAVVAQIAAGTAPLRSENVTAEANRLLRQSARTVDPRWAPDIVDRVLGMGPIGPLLADPEVTDVLVNGPDSVWVDKGGRLQLTDVRFVNIRQLTATIERILAPLGLRLDRSSPVVDARLEDGSRFHAVVPPASVDYPVVAIRRFTQALRSFTDLVDSGTATNQQAETLRALVMNKRNVVVSGGTGTGKTTLLNVLAGLIPDTERVVVVEDASELRLPGHVVRLEARRSNTEGAGEIRIRNLLTAALRLRPDRIVLGEVRGAEALDLIWALNTGHLGSMSSVHANSPVEAMWRLETLALSEGHMGQVAVARQLKSAVHAVVQLARNEGKRIVVDIAQSDQLTGDGGD